MPSTLVNRVKEVAKLVRQLRDRESFCPNPEEVIERIQSYYDPKTEALFAWSNELGFGAIYYTPTKLPRIIAHAVEWAVKVDAKGRRTVVKDVEEVGEAEVLEEAGKLLDGLLRASTAPTVWDRLLGDDLDDL